VLSGGTSTTVQTVGKRLFFGQVAVATAATTFDVMTTAGTAKVYVSSSSTLVFDTTTSAGAALVAVLATGAVTLQAMTSAGAANVYVSATGTVTFDGTVAAGTALVTNTATGWGGLPPRYLLNKGLLSRKARTLVPQGRR
jgi:hypothetical protein